MDVHCIETWPGLPQFRIIGQVLGSQQLDGLPCKFDSLNLSYFVAPTIWLRSCVSPRRLRANRTKRGEPQQGLLVHMYPNFDLLQTAIKGYGMGTSHIEGLSLGYINQRLP